MILLPRPFFDALVAFLGHPSIAACESRRGLRLQTGSLAEETSLALAAALAPDLSVEIGAYEASFSARLKQRLPRVRALAFTNAVAWIDVEGAQRQVIEAASRFLACASAIFIAVETEPV
jgi:hypothetical protein